MDIATLAKDVTRFLPPYLPYLLKAGEKTAEEAGKELGGDAWERAGVCGIDCARRSRRSRPHGKP